MSDQDVTINNPKTNEDLLKARDLRAQIKSIVARITSLKIKTKKSGFETSKESFELKDLSSEFNLKSLELVKVKKKLSVAYSRDLKCLQGLYKI